MCRPFQSIRRGAYENRAMHNQKKAIQGRKTLVRYRRYVTGNRSKRKHRVAGVPAAQRSSINILVPRSTAFKGSKIQFTQSLVASCGRGAQMKDLCWVSMSAAATNSPGWLVSSFPFSSQLFQLGCTRGLKSNRTLSSESTEGSCVDVRFSILKI